RKIRWERRFAVHGDRVLRLRERDRKRRESQHARKRCKARLRAGIDQQHVELLRPKLDAIQHDCADAMANMVTVLPDSSPAASAPAKKGLGPAFCAACLCRAPGAAPPSYVARQVKAFARCGIRLSGRCRASRSCRNWRRDTGRDTGIFVLALVFATATQSK